MIFEISSFRSLSGVSRVRAVVADSYLVVELKGGGIRPAALEGAPVPVPHPTHRALHVFLLWISTFEEFLVVCLDNCCPLTIGMCSFISSMSLKWMSQAPMTADDVVGANFERHHHTQ